LRLGRRRTPSSFLNNLRIASVLKPQRAASSLGEKCLSANALRAVKALSELAFWALLFAKQIPSYLYRTPSISISADFSKKFGGA
jgi:hypothetical protein